MPFIAKKNPNKLFSNTVRQEKTCLFVFGYNGSIRLDNFRLTIMIPQISRRMKNQDLVQNAPNWTIVRSEGVVLNKSNEFIFP